MHRGRQTVQTSLGRFCAEVEGSAQVLMALEFKDVRVHKLL